MTRRMRQTWVNVLVIVLCGIGARHASGQTLITWIGGDCPDKGDPPNWEPVSWSESNNWGPPVVPCSTIYDVIIDRGWTDPDGKPPTPVCLDLSCMINSLSVSISDPLLTIKGETLQVMSGITVADTGALIIRSAGTLVIMEDFVNDGTVKVGAGVSLFGSLVFLGDVVFDSPNDSGIIEFSPNTNDANTIRGTGSGDTVTVPLGKTFVIEGGKGNFGADSLDIINHGAIEFLGIVTCPVVDPIVTIDPGDGGFTNTGILRVRPAGSAEPPLLFLTDGVYNCTGGTIEAMDGTRIVLRQIVTGPILVDATLASDGSGTIEIETGHVATVTGTITNDAHLVFSGSPSISQAQLLLSGEVSWAGSGVVSFSDSNPLNNLIRGAGGPDDQLTIASGETLFILAGGGQVGADSLAIVNDGLLEVSEGIEGAVVEINPNIFGVANTGTLRASNGATLQLRNGRFDNALTGLMEADDSTVQIFDSVVEGGTLRTVSAGQFLIAPGTSGALAGTVTLDGLLRLAGGGPSSPARLEMEGAVVLLGSGVVHSTGNSWIGATGPGGSLHIGALTVLDFILGECKLGDDDLAIVHDGLIRASPGGYIDVRSDVTGTGTWIVDGGTLVNLFGGSAIDTSGSVSVANTGGLELDGNAGLSASDLIMDSTSNLRVVGQSDVTLTGDLTFALNDETAWIWGGGTTLTMAGGLGALIGEWGDWSRLEIGGEDFGDDPELHIGDPVGFITNFELPQLVVGPNAHLLLTDIVDNGNRDGRFSFGEALYVDTLVFADQDGVLNTNGLHLYYNNIIGDVSQIIDDVTCPGDITGDGVVDAIDLTQLLGAWGPCAKPCPRACFADINGDCEVNILDLLTVLAAWGSCP